MSKTTAAKATNKKPATAGTKPAAKKQAKGTNTSRKTKPPSGAEQHYPDDIAERLRAASEATGKPVSHLEIMLIRHGLDELDKGAVTIGSTRHDIRPGEYPEIWESRWVKNVRMIDLVVTAPVEHVRAIAESGKTKVSFGEMIEEMALHFHLDHRNGEKWAREKVKEHCGYSMRYFRCDVPKATVRATVKADLWESFCECLNQSGSSPLWHIRGLIGRFHENWPAAKRRSDATAKLHLDLEAGRITRSEFNRKLHKICTK